MNNIYFKKLLITIIIFIGFYENIVYAGLVFVTDDSATNEHAFYIDSADTSDDYIDLEFGRLLDAKLRYDIVNNNFTLNRDLHLLNGLQIDGILKDKDGDVGNLGDTLVARDTGVNWEYHQDANEAISTYSGGMVANGSQCNKDNPMYNFSTFHGFDASMGKDSCGSIYYTGVYHSRFGDNFMQVVDGIVYKLTTTMKLESPNDNTLRQYTGFAMFDVDGHSITSEHHMRITGTDTTLSADLNNGDTVIHLTDASNWVNSTSATYRRRMSIYNYVSATGQTYAPYTYTRNLTKRDLWANGAVDRVANTITLTDPWDGGFLASGTPVSNSSAGGTYKYVAWRGHGISVSDGWVQREGYIGGFDLSGTNKTNNFPPGTAYVKLMFLPNYRKTPSGTADANDKIHLTGIDMSRQSDMKLRKNTNGSYEIIGWRKNDNGLSYTENIGINTTSPENKLDIESNGQLIELGDKTANDIKLNFDDGVDHEFGWDDSENTLSTFNNELMFRTKQSSNPPNACSSSYFGTQWLDTDTGILYVCDASNGRNKWLSPLDNVIFGEETSTCGQGQDPNSSGNCNVDWGNSLGSDTNSSLGFYLPQDITITGYGFSSDNDGCTAGSFDVEVWGSGSNANDDDYTLDQEIATGLDGQVHNANNLNIDIDGNQYIIWGLDNNCTSGTLDDWNVVLYYRYRHD